MVIIYSVTVDGEEDGLVLDTRRVSHINLPPLIPVTLVAINGCLELSEVDLENSTYSPCTRYRY